MASGLNPGYSKPGTKLSSTNVGVTSEFDMSLSFEFSLAENWISKVCGFGNCSYSLLLSANKETPKLNVMYNPDSLNNAQMNFKPDTSKMSAKLSYDPDKLNDYSGMFKPGQMFPVVSMNTPSASHLMFNADILNKKLMDEQLPNPQTLDIQGCFFICRK
jgi:hypothetical protein